MRRLTFGVPEGQSPFFDVGGAHGAVYANLLWNWGHPLIVAADDLLRTLQDAGPAEILVGRRLDARELRVLREHRGDSDSEAFAFLVPSDDARWRGRR